MKITNFFKQNNRPIFLLLTDPETYNTSYESRFDFIIKHNSRTKYFTIIVASLSWVVPSKYLRYIIDNGLFSDEIHENIFFLIMEFFYKGFFVALGSFLIYLALSFTPKLKEFYYAGFIEHHGFGSYMFPIEVNYAQSVSRSIYVFGDQDNRFQEPTSDAFTKDSSNKYSKFTLLRDREKFHLLLPQIKQYSKTSISVEVIQDVSFGKINANPANKKKLTLELFSKGDFVSALIFDTTIWDSVAQKGHLLDIQHRIDKSGVKFQSSIDETGQSKLDETQYSQSVQNIS